MNSPQSLNITGTKFFSTPVNTTQSKTRSITTRELRLKRLQRTAMSPRPQHSEIANNKLMDQPSTEIKVEPLYPVNKETVHTASKSQGINFVPIGFPEEERKRKSQKFIVHDSNVKAPRFSVTASSKRQTAPLKGRKSPFTISKDANSAVEYSVRERTPASNYTLGNHFELSQIGSPTSDNTRDEIRNRGSLLPLQNKEASSSSSKFFNSPTNTTIHKREDESLLTNELVSQRIIKNNENIIRKKLSIMQRNQSVKRHIGYLSTPKSRDSEATSRFTPIVSSSRPATTAAKGSSHARLFTSASSRLPNAKLASSSREGDLTKLEASSTSRTIKLEDFQDNRNLVQNSIESLEESENQSPPFKKLSSIQSIAQDSMMSINLRSKKKTSIIRTNKRFKTSKLIKPFNQSPDSSPVQVQTGGSVFSTLEESMHFHPDDLEGVEVNIEHANLQKKDDTRKLIQFDPATYKSMDTTLTRLNNRFRYLVDQEENLQAIQKEETDFLKVNELRLCEYEIRVIQREYAKKPTAPDQIDWQRLDSLSQQVKFFAKFPKEVRLTLLREANYHFYPRGEFVFKQGEYGDLMYVILRGSCNIRVDCKEVDKNRDDKIINVLYDGDHFGELAMMGTSAKSKMQLSDTHLKDLMKRGKSSTDQKNAAAINTPLPHSNSQSPKKISNKEMETDALGLRIPTAVEEGRNYFERTKRSASVQVAESVDLLSIPRDRFKQILLTLIQDELDLKLKVLLKLPFFEKIEPFSLIPLANNLTSSVFKMGDVILKEGDAPIAFVLIAKGRVNIIKETILTRMLEPTELARTRKPALRGFNYKQVSERAEAEQGSKEIERIEGNGQPELPTNTELTKRSFHNQKIKEDKEQNKAYYRQHIVFGTLEEGEFFGGRSVLGEDIAKDNFEFHEFLKKVPKAKLSAVAASSEVEIFKIDKKQLLYVPNKIKKVFEDGLAQCKEFDDLEVEKEFNSVNEWNNFKQREVMKHLQDQYLSKSGPQRYKKY